MAMPWLRCEVAGPALGMLPLHVDRLQTVIHPDAADLDAATRASAARRAVNTSMRPQCGAVRVGEGPNAARPVALSTSPCP